LPALSIFLLPPRNHFFRTLEDETVTVFKDSNHVFLFSSWKNSRNRNFRPFSSYFGAGLDFQPQVLWGTSGRRGFYPLPLKLLVTLVRFSSRPFFFQLISTPSRREEAGRIPLAPPLTPPPYPASVSPLIFPSSPPLPSLASENRPRWPIRDFS